MLSIFNLHICRSAERLSAGAPFLYGLNFIKRGFSTTQKMRGPKITSIIFDFDGVILDTETVFYEVNSKIFKSLGGEYNKDLKLGQMGRKLTEGTEYILKESGLDKKISLKNYLKQYDELLEKMLVNTPEMPGARKLIEHLYKNKIQMSICTGSAGGEFRLKTKKFQDIVDKFPLIVLAGDDPKVKRGKPAPDPYLATMERMQPPVTDPKSVLVFEDSMNGVLSAAAANNTVIWIPQEQFKPDNWDEVRARVEPKCAEILSSMEEFDPAKYGLPPY